MKETGSYLLDVLFMGGLITASLCDFKKRKIPDAITGFLFLTGVAALFWMPQPSIKMRRLLPDCRFLRQLYAGREQSAAEMSS